jgi:hypothetical protein
LNDPVEVGDVWFDVANKSHWYVSRMTFNHVEAEPSCHLICVYADHPSAMYNVWGERFSITTYPISLIETEKYGEWKLVIRGYSTEG